MRLPTDPTCVLVQMQAVTHQTSAIYRRMRRHSFGHVGLSQIASVAQDVEARLDEVPARAMESTQFQFVHAGSLIVEHAGGQTRYGAGELAVYDASRPFSFVYPAEFRATIVQLPTVLLRANGVFSDPLEGASISAGSIGRRLLEDQLRASIGEVASSGMADPSGRSSAIASAARLILAERTRTVERPPVRSATLVGQVLDHVSHSFADPGLSAASIAARFQVSLRTLFAAFEREDRSLGSLIRATRLAAAERLLLTTPRTVAEVAHDVGYLDVTAFIRAWKAATGETPARWRRQNSGGSAGVH